MPDPLDADRRASRGEFSDRFAQALRDSRRSLSWLQQRLEANGHRVSLAALSYWRSGQRQPEGLSSFEALAEVERLLALEPRHLRDAVGPSRRPGPELSAVSFDDLIASPHPRVEAALDELDLGDWTDHFTELSSHVVVQVDAEGREHDVTTRAVLRGRTTGASRYPFFLYAGEPVATPVEIVPRGGCRIGRQVRDHDEGLFVAEILLDRPLDAGETAFVEVSISFPPQRFEGYQQFVARRIGELVVLVQFHPDRLPASIETFRDAEGHRSALPFDRAGGTSAHQVLRSFGPGTAGLTWTWDEG